MSIAKPYEGGRFESHWEPFPVIRWLMQEGRFMEGNDLLAELGRRLILAGAPVWGLSVGYRMLHPQLRAASGLWTRDSDEVRTYRFAHTVADSDRYQGSPIQTIYEKNERVRVRLNSDFAKGYILYAELLEQGYTDYVGLPMRFSDNTGSYMIATTKAADGFRNHDIRNLVELTDYVAPIFETLARDQLARSLLDTYVGRRTGSKVLRGMISRGNSETIEAALWFSDLRNFTHFTETLPANELLSLLNTYFEFVAAAVTARGGEILRFIGDAMLIVFPVQSGTTGVRDACKSALESAQDAFNSLATFNHRRRRIGMPVIEFGVGLNVGEVIYGNVGAPDRLDFTVMGPAVNRVARLESLTKALGEPILVSRAFADALTQQMRSLGNHTMKGVPEPQEVLAPSP